MRIFKEAQRFTQLWIHLLLLISFIIPFVIVLFEYSKPNNESKSALLILIITFFLTYGFILWLNLKTRIDENGIHYKFSPFHFSFKTILWKDIDEFEIRTYDPISEYGGWGIKSGTFMKNKKGIAYNVKGDIGLQLHLKNGKKILIGTQKSEELNKTLIRYKTKIHEY